ncbi:nucleoside-triphosphate diphosphatase [Streptococcus sp. S784/96/1]|uniref:nucleoside-triphosphate diphosphatase n=1 Tax=Streptococcus sp. S784/96/1 TaxID=2653499 RepID=UPI001386A8B3|nr:nucleoside-triphosphate diphosphatase [Streptococcus sp. S784/96/1]
MTEKIYEYKDDNNWFIGKGSFANMFSSFGENGREQDISRLAHQLDQLIFPRYEDDFNQCVAIEVIRLQSDVQLIQFALEILNDLNDRQFRVVHHKGTVLIIEGEKLYSVYVSTNGVSLKDFFGQSDTGFGDTLLIATKNEGKTKEFRQCFDKMGIKVENLNDYPDLPDVEETGTTFEANARLKAETIAKLTGKMVLADDSGLKVDVLGGLPGVWSARFSGPDATDAKNNAKLLHELQMVFNQSDRTAQFHCCLVVASPDKESLVVEAEWPGYIGMQAQGDNGFGYDPLFLVGETGRTAAQLSSDEKNEQSHRGLAVKKLMEVFPTWLNTH